MPKKIKSRNALSVWLEDEAEIKRAKDAARKVEWAYVSLDLRDDPAMTEDELIARLPGRIKHIDISFRDEGAS